ncbi:MAG TPA: hypothetical protein VGF94_00075 [Kofleriaceae bacterium]
MHRLAILIPVLLAACASAPTAIEQLQTEQPAIDTLHFTTASSIAQNAPPAVDVTVTGDAARDVYAATLALPALAPGAYNCPADFGITYYLDFSGGGGELVRGTVQPGGCEQVELSATVGSASLGPDGAYWAMLATDLGIDETAIYPYVPE